MLLYSDTASIGWLPDHIEQSPDLARIKALPVLDWKSDEDLPGLISGLTALLTTDLGKRKGHRYDPEKPSALEPDQAAALASCWANRGLVAPLLAGKGKTLVSFLLETLLQVGPTLLVVPGSLHGKPKKSKTLRDLRAYAPYWRVCAPVVHSYEELSRKAGATKIARAAPKIVILDECQEAKDPSCAAWRKLHRWMTEHPGTILVVMSASMITRDIMDCQHLCTAALGARSPIPVEIRTALSWRYAIGEKVREDQRLDPGPLEYLAPASVLTATDPLDRAREAFGWRFTSSPGVIASVHDRPPMGLEVEVRLLPKTDEMVEALAYLRVVRGHTPEGKPYYETPDGYPLFSELEIWTREQQMEQGLYSVWDPPAPEDYRQARRDWRMLVNDILGRPRSEIDSEEQVKDLARAGQIAGGAQILADWDHWFAEFKPNTVWHWFDDTMMGAVLGWVARSAGSTGVVWVDHPEVGARLARETGLPYFQSKGWTADGKHHMEGCKTSCIASVQACSVGLNVHKHFDRGMHVGWESVGARCEQTIGRTHRDGSSADVVRVVVPVIAKGRARSLLQAVSDSVSNQYKTRVPQKLAYCTWVGEPLETLLEAVS